MPHGSCIIVDFITLKESNFFYENIFLQGEEVIIAEKACRQGAFVMFEPNLKVLHNVASATGKLPGKSKFELGEKVMQLIDYISETCLDKIKSQILNFVSENGCRAVYYTANFNNYSNTSPLIESVCARLAKYLIVFCDTSSAKAYRIEDDKGYLFITVDWDKNIDARLFAKIFKVMPHLFFPKTVKTIWLDANISMKNDDVELVRELEKSDLILFSHNKRNSVTEEYKECLKFQKDLSQKLKQFSEFLLHNKDPEFLCQGRIIYRNTNLKFKILMKFGGTT